MTVNTDYKILTTRFCFAAASFCSLSCPLPWLGDGSCDPSCNTDECGFDGNDCPQTAIQNVDDHSDSKANVTIMMQVRLERDTTQTGNPADKSALDKAFEDFPAGMCLMPPIQFALTLIASSL